VVLPVSAAPGASVAVRVAAAYVTVAATGLFDPSRRLNVLPLTVAGSIASLNVALADAKMSTPVAPLAGDLPVTVGAVASTA